MNFLTKLLFYMILILLNTRKYFVKSLRYSAHQKYCEIIIGVIATHRKPKNQMIVLNMAEEV